MYMADLDPERGENVHVLMPINYLRNIRNTVKRLLNIILKLVMQSKCEVNCTANSDGSKFVVPLHNMPK